MNGQQQYPPYTPQQVPYGYTAAPNSFPPSQQSPYTYTPPPPQQHHQHQQVHLQHQQNQQQQQHPSSQPHQQHQPHFFQPLPQGVTTRPQQLQHQHQQIVRQHSQGFANNRLHHGPPSLPSSPGNGPGAPPPESNSPPGSDHIEQDLVSAFARESETHNPQANNDDANCEGQQNDNEDDLEDSMRADADADDPVYQLPPPPENIYPDAEELEKAIHAWSREHGYDLVRRASKKNSRKQLYKRYYHCNKHGRGSSTNKTPEKDRVRVNRKSNRIGCPMSLAAVAVDPANPAGDWQIRLRKTHHNHPAVGAIELSGHRRRARTGVEKAVDGLFEIGTDTTNVLKWLQKTNPNGLFNRTDVANMKLKYKKFGTCVKPGDDSLSGKQAGIHLKTGFPSACMACRSRKSRCDSVRPACGYCVKSQANCVYDHDPHPRVTQPGQMDDVQPSSDTFQSDDQNGAQFLSETTPTQNRLPPSGPSMMDLESATEAPGFLALSQTVPNVEEQSRQAVLAALANFQQEHVKPSRLSLESSSVEVLANSTCGNGDSYRSVLPRPFTLGADWRAFKDNFSSAAAKENTYGVLVGDKREPQKPSNDASIEEHNEYIRQLAIYRRRNEMLKAGMKESLHPSLWSRVSSHREASAIWRHLEDMCMPRGSETAYSRFLELENLTLQHSGTLENYIHGLEVKYASYNELTHHHDTRRASTTLNMSNAGKMKRSAGGNGAFPDEILCFVFLKNLGPQYHHLATSLTKKNNIGGFGSGERVGFKELAGLVRKAMEWDQSRASSTR